MADAGLRLPAAPAREAEYGHDALVVCDNLVRIYQSEAAIARGALEDTSRTLSDLIGRPTTSLAHALAQHVA